MRQASFADLAFDTKKKTTKRERFLAEMDAVIPWPRLLALIEPHYPKGERGRRPIGLERMLRVYFVQQWYALSDPLVEESLYDSDALRRFVGLRLGHDAVPDESTVLQFRRLLERHELTERLVRRGGGAVVRTRSVDESGNDCRCDDHSRAEFDQERGG